MSPPATFNGLFLKDDIIQSNYDLLMARRSCLRDTLSRGVFAYLASRIECISTPTRYSEMLKCFNLNCHLRDQEYLYLPIQPKAALLISLGILISRISDL